jgi:hypothetical protein
MAIQPVSTLRTARPAANRAAMGPMKKASMLAGLAALIGAASARNVMAASMLMVGAPLTATGFVYEVQTLRKAQLAHEATDRAQYASYLAERSNMADDRELAAPPAFKKSSGGDDGFGAKVDGMIKSRSVLLDTFGDDASSVAPVYATIIKRMLQDDEDAFDKFAEKRSGATPDEAAKLAEQEALLQDIHAKLSRLTKG